MTGGGGTAEPASGPANNDDDDGGKRIAEICQSKSTDEVAQSTEVRRLDPEATKSSFSIDEKLGLKSSLKSELTLQDRLKQTSSEGGLNFPKTFSETLSETEIVRKTTASQSACSTNEMSKDSLDSPGN